VAQGRQVELRSPFVVKVGTMDASNKARTTNISDFTMNCHRYAKDVAQTGRKLIVTRHGSPLVEVTPVVPPRSLIGSVTYLCSDEELMTPIDVKWNASA
jgi:hypothetical protein